MERHLLIGLDRGQTRADTHRAVDAAQAKQNIERMHATIMRRNFFQILGVDRDTDAERVRASYHMLAKKWHSDAFTGVTLGDAKTKLDEIFQRINEAYDTLTDPKKRAEYLILVDRQQKGMATDVSQVLYGEQIFDEALGKMKRRDWAGALDAVDRAINLNPDDRLYQATKGWILFNLEKRDEKNVKKALDLIKDAVKKQENLPLGYQYGGQIFFAREELDEARRWFKKCLEWDSKNVEAARLLRLANAREEKKKNSGLGAIFSKLFGGSKK
jgi:curved DNA-binding protein CbpA